MERERETGVSDEGLGDAPGREPAWPPAPAPPIPSGRADEGEARPASSPIGPSIALPLGVLLVPAALLTLGSLLWPEVVWERFVDKYYWTPIVQDEGYNPVNTASWALLLGALLFLVAGLMRRLRQAVDLPLILAVLPYIAFGSVFRVLEDTKMFGEPLRYFLITPIIYVIILIFAILVLLLAFRVRSVGDRLGTAKGLQLFAGVLLLAVSLWTLVWATQPDLALQERSLSFVANPVFLAAPLAVAYAFVHRHARATGRVAPVMVLGSVGFGILLFAGYHLVQWHAATPWSPIVPSGVGVTAPACIRAAYGGGTPECEPSFWVYAAALLLPIPFVALVWWTGAWARRTSLRAWAGLFALLAVLFAALLVARSVDLGTLSVWGREIGGRGLVVLGAVAAIAGYRLYGRAGKAAAGSGFTPLPRRNLFQIAFTHPLNLVLVFAQMMDATMTSLGIDYFHYTEKHVVPSTLIGLLGAVGPNVEAYAATLVMIPFKFAVSVLVVWAIDVYAAEDARAYPVLVNLAKLAIIIVGLGPGVRDAVRVAMGV